MNLSITLLITLTIFVNCEKINVRPWSTSPPINGEWEDYDYNRILEEGIINIVNSNNESSTPFLEKLIKNRILEEESIKFIGFDNLKGRILEEEEGVKILGSDNYNIKGRVLEEEEGINIKGCNNYDISGRVLAEEIINMVNSSNNYDIITRQLKDDLILHGSDNHNI